MFKTDRSNTPRTPVLQLSYLEYSLRNKPLQTTEQPKSIAAAGFHMPMMIRRSFLVLLAAMMVLFYPLGSYVVFAEGTPPPAETQATETTSATQAPAASTTDTAPEPAAAPKPATPATTGPKKPTGADSKKYVKNEQTGLYENDTYTWDPVTKKTAPKTPQTYSYNPATNKWDTEEYVYDPTVGKYVPNVVSVDAPPAGAATQGAPPSNSQGDSDGSTFGLFYNAEISNRIYSSAASGDAAVSYNTTGGSALTGDALAIANIINIIQSSASFGGGEVATFSTDVHGDVFGDLYIDPSVLATVQPASSGGDLQVNADMSGQINNDITLNASSGNATVEKNTTAGDATSGSADAVLNLINILNSAISSGSSFIGMLNIYGNLNGDILLPTGLLETLLAANSGSSSASGDFTANLDSNQTINNNVNLAAASGNALVDHNTTAGSATTGNAETNVTILNLTGRQVIAANSLLVFVNVLGKWVGVIMDAPAGSTSAAIGGGVTQNDCSACGGDTELDIESNQAINNNIDVTAHSGDATVRDNTTAGDATSGDATASANILNIMNSSINLSDWFGVLFINVFGEWFGSFGKDTAAGEKPDDTAAKPKPGKVASKNTGKPAAKVFKFVPSGQGGEQTLASTQVDDATMEKAVKAATEKVKKEQPQKSQPTKQQPVEENQDEEVVQSVDGPDFLLPVIGFALGGSLLGGEQIVSRRQRRKS